MKMATGFKKGLVRVCACSAMVLGASMARAEVVLPTTGLDLSEYATAALTAIAVLIAAAIGIKVAIRVLKLGIQWVLSGLRG